MTWYAVRTAPGSQMPKREYFAEKTRSPKGYRLAISLDPRMSAVERALSEAGFVYYMPAEKRLQRDRRKPFVWKTRRFALMVGYIFVRDPESWRKLLDTPGVIGVVSDMAGNPRGMELHEMLKIRSAEGAAEVDFDDTLRKARQGLRKAAKKDASLKKLVEELDIAGTIGVPLQELAA
jgi:transcription antitermination factor NusG